MQQFNNLYISSLFSKMATSLLLQDEKKNLFRILAYKKAAEIIQESSNEFYDLWRENKLTGIPGIGKGTIGLLNELFTTGHTKDLENEIEKFPESVYFLQNIRGIGPKTAYQLAQLLEKNNKSIDSRFRGNDKVAVEKIIIDKVIKLCKEHKIAKLPGFGEKSENDILESVKRYTQGVKKDTRLILPKAEDLAEKFVEWMKICKNVEKIEILGSLRRKMETIGDIDIAVTSDNPEAAIKHFVSYKYISRILDSGENKASLEMSNGMRVDLRVIDSSQWGSMMAHFTGSKDHNVALREYAIKKGLSISEYGIKISYVGTGLTTCPIGRVIRPSPTKNKIKRFTSEKEFYKFLDLQYIPPELRENKGELEESLRGAQGKLPGLPILLTLDDIKGDFHLHSNFDVSTSHDLGSNSFEEMLNKAKSLKYEYLAFSEHNPSMSKNTKTQKSEILKRKKEEVDRLNQPARNASQSDAGGRNPYIFNSLEVDILPDGSLAIEEEHLKYLDFIIISIHSSFEQDRASQTKRILKALSFPKVKIIGHPTGRLVQKREEIKFDHDAVFAMCAKNKIAVEISASPYRNDLNWKEILKLKSLDISYIINTDSHAVNEMDLMRYGVWNARKGWLTAQNVVNTKNLAEVRKFMLS